MDGKQLSDDELLAKCGTTEPITRSDLGVNTSSSQNGLDLLNEGFNVLTYTDHSSDEH